MNLEIGYNIFVYSTDYCNTKKCEQIVVSDKNTCSLVVDISKHFCNNAWGGKNHNRTDISNLINRLLDIHPLASTDYHVWLRDLDSGCPTDALMTFIGYDVNEPIYDDNVDYYRSVTDVVVYYIESPPTDLSSNFNYSNITPPIHEDDDDPVFDSIEFM